jgi:hypothetical protein
MLSIYLIFWSYVLSLQVDYMFVMFNLKSMMFNFSDYRFAMSNFKVHGFQIECFKFTMSKS